MMRLAMVTPYPRTSDEISGGVESVASILISALDKLTSDVEIHVVSPCYQHMSPMERRENVTIHWVRTAQLPGVFRYWSYDRKALHRCLELIDPDVTHFQGVAGWTLGYSRPSVLSIHGIPEREAKYQNKRFGFFREKIFEQVEKIGRRRQDDKIVISPYVAEIVGHNLGGRLWNIENPVSDECFGVSRKVEKLSVLYVGRVNERKNVLGLMKAFHGASRRVKGAELRIAGQMERSAYSERCMAYAREHSLNVHFLGNINRMRLMEELSAAACLVLPSRQETAPIVVGEAMAAGVPVIASNICGIPYMVCEGETGYLVAPDDIAGFTERITLLLNNFELNAQMGTCAQDVALRRFSAITVARRTLAVYCAVIGKSEACYEG